ERKFPPFRPSGPSLLEFERQWPYALGAGTGRAFQCEPGTDPRGAGDSGGDAHRRAAGEIRHLPDDDGGERRGDGAVRPRRRTARPDPDLRDGGTAQDPRDKAAELACLRATEEN